MNCPACTKPFHTLLVCPACWELIPKPDRVQLGNTFLRHRDKPQVYRTKYESVVNRLRRNAGLPPVASAIINQRVAFVTAAAPVTTIQLQKA